MRVGGWWWGYGKDAGYGTEGFASRVSLCAYMMGLEVGGGVCRLGRQRGTYTVGVTVVVVVDAIYWLQNGDAIVREFR